MSLGVLRSPKPRRPLDFSSGDFGDYGGFTPPESSIFGDGGYDGGGFTEDPTAGASGGTIDTNNGFDPVGAAAAITDPAPPATVDTGLGSFGGDALGPTSGTTPAGTDGGYEYLPPSEGSPTSGIPDSSSGDSTSQQAAYGEEPGYDESNTQGGPSSHEEAFLGPSSHEEAAGHLGVYGSVSDSGSDSGNGAAVLGVLGTVFNSIGNILGKKGSSSITIGGTNIGSLPGVSSLPKGISSPSTSSGGGGSLGDSVSAILGAITGQKANAPATKPKTPISGSGITNPANTTAKKAAATSSSILWLVLLVGGYFFLRR